MGSNQPRMFDVPRSLRNHVECFILNELSSAKTMSISVFPNADPGIVFHHSAGKPAIENIIMRSGRKTFPSTSFLHGPGIESSVMNFAQGSYAVIQVILKPHALNTLFGINALALKDCTVELNEFSSEDINEQLLNVTTAQEQIDLLTSFLLAKFKQAKARDILVEESLRLIYAGAGRVTVKSLLQHLNISERQFERRFCQTVGISPAAYIRVKRFNEAIRLIKSGKYKTLTDVAYALDFHDQSHFIRDVKAFTGITPKSLLQKVDEVYHNPAGYSYI
jgi:AraC-like DNA-binding protein